MFSVLLVLALLQSPAPTPVRVTLALAYDAAHDGLPIVVQSYQGSQPCTNVRSMGNERHCVVTIVRPNMVRLSTVRQDGLFGGWSNFIEIPAAGNGNGTPGQFRVTFAGELKP